MSNYCKIRAFSVTKILQDPYLTLFTTEAISGQLRKSLFEASSCQYDPAIVFGPENGPNLRKFSANGIWLTGCSFQLALKYEVTEAFEQFCRTVVTSANTAKL